MNTRLVWWIGGIWVLGLTSTALSLEGNNTQEKIGRVFSLFSIVSFKNTGCRSQSSSTTGSSTTYRNGTCFTSTECSAKGGTSSGNCAAGFGVCCVFLITSGSVNQNCSYLRNQGFPTPYTAAGSLMYTVSKSSSDVCYLRLDFDTFQTTGPADETAGGVCSFDNLKITTTVPQAIPNICGANTGQHIYINLGAAQGNQAFLTFTFGTPAIVGEVSSKLWEIKVTQIECSNLSRPPPGCTQYFTTPSGRITTFNFFSADVLQHLGSQDVTTCIRSQAGYCCIQYFPCPEFADSFSIDSAIDIATGASFVNDMCSMDYVSIPGATGTCNQVGPIVSKFCSTVFEPTMIGGGSNVPVCDCRQPFYVHFHTDALPDSNLLGGGSRGVCFDYNLIPCK